MSEITASPSTRKLALEKGVDLEAQAKKLGRRTIGPEDLESGGAAAPTGDTSYWAVDHAAHGPVTEEPMSRFAQVAARNLAAAQALIPAVTHHDRADVSGIEALRAKLRPSWATSNECVKRVRNKSPSWFKNT